MGNVSVIAYCTPLFMATVRCDPNPKFVTAELRTDKVYLLNGTIYVAPNVSKRFQFKESEAPTPLF